jgi:hypothetical protein
METPTEDTTAMRTTTCAQHHENDDLSTTKKLQLGKKIFKAPSPPKRKSARNPKQSFNDQCKKKPCAIKHQLLLEPTLDRQKRRQRMRAKLLGLMTSTPQQQQAAEKGLKTANDTSSSAVASSSVLAFAKKRMAIARISKVERMKKEPKRGDDDDDLLPLSYFKSLQEHYGDVGHKRDSSLNDHIPEATYSNCFRRTHKPMANAAAKPGMGIQSSTSSNCKRSESFTKHDGAEDTGPSAVPPTSCCGIESKLKKKKKKKKRSRRASDVHIQKEGSWSEKGKRKRRRSIADQILNTSSPSYSEWLSKEIESSKSRLSGLSIPHISTGQNFASRESMPEQTMQSSDLLFLGSQSRGFRSESLEEDWLRAISTSTFEQHPLQESQAMSLSLGNNSSWNEPTTVSTSLFGLSSTLTPLVSPSRLLSIAQDNQYGMNALRNSMGLSSSLTHFALNPLSFFPCPLRSPSEYSDQRLSALSQERNAILTELDILAKQKTALEILKGASDLPTIIASLQYIKTNFQNALLRPGTKQIVEAAECASLSLMTAAFFHKLTSACISGGLGYSTFHARMVLYKLAPVMGSKFGFEPMDFAQITNLGLTNEECLSLVPYMKRLEEEIHTKSYMIARQIMMVSGRELSDVPGVEY